MNLIIKLAVITTVLMIQGCVSSQYSSDNSMSQLIIAEPLSINYKSEIALARLTEVIQRADVRDDQRAQLYYDRGVIYDSVGLRSLARLDFNRALRLKPDLVDAHNFLGIHYTQLQEFNQAYDAFDSAIDLSPEHEYAYLNRGIALYYGGRPQLAVEDFKVFHENQASDPYRLLWLYLAEVDINPEKAKNELLEGSQLVADSVWAKQVIQLFLGKITHSAFIDRLTINVQSNKELTERLCEAYFYLGKYSQIRHQPSVAANYFKLALSTNVYEFVEHRYAKLELDLMRETISGRVEP